MATPSSPTFPANPMSIADRLALTLETACGDFEVLQRLIRKDVKLITEGGQEDYRGAGAIRMALAKSFVFHVVRSRRICEHGKASLQVGRLERTQFLKATANVLSVRDVNEHGYDVNGNISKPTMHEHVQESAILDETSMIALSDRKILMGPVNLYDVYVPTDRMRKLAGFGARRGAERD